MRVYPNHVFASRVTLKLQEGRLILLQRRSATAATAGAQLASREEGGYPNNHADYQTILRSHLERAQRRVAWWMLVDTAVALVAMA